MTLASLLERSRTEKEIWRYTDLAALLAAPSPPQSTMNKEYYALPESAFLLFMDGVWMPEPSRLDGLPPDFITGNATTGYRLSLEGQTCLVTQPVELCFQTSGSAPEVNVKLDVELGESGRLTLLESHRGQAVTVIETVIHLAPQAKLIHGKVLTGTATSAHLEKTKVTAQHGAYYDAFTLIEGGKLTRTETDVSLAGREAQASLAAVMLLGGKDHADVVTHVAHAVPDGVSQQSCTAVLTDRARGVYQGKVYVAQDAQKTDASQLCRALLLSDKAEMDAKPELEIYADDVKCSHGCAVGDLDDEALFYLRSRGIDAKEARSMLIRAFIEERLTRLSVEGWRDRFRTVSEGWLHEKG